MRKKFALVVVLSLAFCLAGCSFASEIPALEEVITRTAEDFEIYMSGVSREQIIKAWGEPIESLPEENADMWDIDAESSVVIYWDDNGKLKSGNVEIKESGEM